MMSISQQLQAVQATRAVIALGAQKRILEPQIPLITYFSEHDIWLFDVEAVRSTGEGPCIICEIADRISQFRGNNLRMNFPNLVILDRDTIGGPEAGGGGLAHKNCRCLLIRLIGEH